MAEHNKYFLATILMVVCVVVLIGVGLYSRWVIHQMTWPIGITEVVTGVITHAGIPTPAATSKKQLNFSPPTGVY
jgi:flagellar basal body-associated protein FliL